MRSVEARRLRLVLAIGVVITAAVLVVPAAAVAQPIKLRSCYQGASGLAESGVGWLPTTDDAPLHSVHACPRELGFETTTAVRQGTTAELEFSVGSLKTDSVSVSIAKGETVAGVSYEFSACSLGACTTLGRIDQRSAADDAETLTWPLTGEWIELHVRATCEIAVCDAGQGLKFNDVDFDAVDTEPPIIGVSLSPYSWARPGEVAVSLTAADGGVGFGDVSAVVDGSAQATPFWAVGGCDLTALPVIVLPIDPRCAQSDHLSYDGMIDTRGLADGSHTVTLSARDAAGNVSTPMVSTFRIDGTPPAAPENVVADALNADGWTAFDQTRMSWTNTGETRSTAVSSGLQQGFVDFEPRSGQSVDPPPVSFGPGGPNGDWGGPFAIPGDGRWDLYLWLRDAAGNMSPKVRIPVGRDTNVPQPPELDAVPWLNRATVSIGRHLDGVQPVGPEVESGVCGYAAAFDDTASAVPAPAINYRGAVSAVRIPGDLPTGESFAHLRAVSCSGLASAVATIPLRLDDRPPIAGLSGDSSSGWSRRPVDLKLTATDDRSGVEGVSYRVDNGATRSASGDQSDLAVGEGEHRLRFWAVDRAGNESSPEERQIDVDLSPPSGGFDAPDPTRPRTISAAVADSLSGVESAQIQYRRVDVADDTWHGIPTAATADQTDPSRLNLAAEMPDTQLADGIYALRVLAADRAGNDAAIDAVSGSDDPMRLRLPLRERSALTAATLRRVSAVCAAKRGRAKRSRCVRGTSDGDAKQTRLVDFRDTVTLVGDLRDVRGEPRAGVPLKIYSAVKGRPPEQIAATTTGADGRYGLRLPPGPSRRLTVAYEGDNQNLPVKANADLLVRAAATLSIRPSVTTVGRTVRISGRLASGDNWLPDVGKLIELQFKNGDVWQPGLGSIWALPGDDGRFGTTYTFSTPRTTVTRIKVRALVRHEAAWPFEDGASNTVVVTLRP